MTIIDNHRFRSMAIILFIALIFVLPLAKTGYTLDYKEEHLMDSILDFSFSTFNLLVKNGPKQDKVLFSPLSVYTVLMMAHLGARKKTSNQICNTLKLCDFNKTMIHQAFGELSKSLTADNSLKDALEIANGFFVQENSNISRYYEQALKSIYDASLKEVDFKDPSALNAINSWVRESTKGKIQAVLHKNPIPATKMIIANAVHFRSQWKWMFNPLDTNPKGNFYITPTQRTEVPIMSGIFYVGLGHSTKSAASILELPFIQSRVSMFLILPDNTEEFPELNAAAIKELIGTMRKKEVNVRLPRFTIDRSPELTGLLWALGIKDIFLPSEADLTGISSDRLFVSDFIHRALIQVDEKGSVGSAASATLMERVGHTEAEYFEANHPFIFLVMDKKSGAVLFIGHIAGF